VLSALGADANTQSEAIGIAELGEVMSDLTEQPETAGAGQVVAVAAVGDDSTLLMQINGGSFAISEELMRPLLSDREVASHYLSVNADSQFIWWSNGTRVAEFELFGSSPVVGDDRMVDLILDVGGIGIDDDAQGYAGEHALEGAFALAEQITGVAVPPRYSWKANLWWPLSPSQDSPPRQMCHLRLLRESRPLRGAR